MSQNTKIEESKYEDISFHKLPLNYSDSKMLKEPKSDFKIKACDNLKNTDYYNAYCENHDLLSDISVGFFIPKNDKMEKRYSHFALDNEIQLSEIFTSASSYQTILQSFTSSNARVSY